MARERKRRPPSARLDEPTTWRLQHGVVTAPQRIADPETGTPVAVRRAIDTLGQMLSNNTITPEMHEADEAFRSAFRAAALDPLRAAPLLRVPAATGETLTERAVAARMRRKRHGRPRRPNKPRRLLRLARRGLPDLGAGMGDAPGLGRTPRRPCPSPRHPRRRARRACPALRLHSAPTRTTRLTLGNHKWYAFATISHCDHTAPTGPSGRSIGRPWIASKPSRYPQATTPANRIQRPSQTRRAVPSWRLAYAGGGSALFR